MNEIGFYGYGYGVILELEWVVVVGDDDVLPFSVGAISTWREEY